MTEELFPPNSYAKDKADKAIENLRKTYYAGSTFAKITSKRDANPEEEGFLQIGFRHLVPKEWFTRKDIHIDLVFTQFAEHLHIAEEKYLINKIFEDTRVPRVDLGDNALNDFIAQFKAFSQNHSIEAMLTPIDFYVPMHTDWLRQTNEIKMNLVTGELIISKIKPYIFWSNKYTPFNDFVLINIEFGEWASKPNFNNRLEIKMTKSDKEDQLDLLFLTRAKFEIVDPSKTLILQTKGKKEASTEN